MSMTAPEDDSLSFGQLLRIVRRQLVLVAAFVAGTCAAGVVVILATKPVYRCETLVKPARSLESAGGLGSMLGQAGGLGALVGLGTATDEISKEALAVVNSRKFVKEFIAAYGLMPVLFKESWDAPNQRWKPGLKHEPTDADAYGRFTNNIFDAFKDRKTGFIKLQIDWTNREEAATWVNRIVEKLNDEMRLKAIDEATQTLNYLEEESRKTQSVEVRAAIFSLMESQLKIKTIASVRKQYAFEVLDPAVAPDIGSVLRPKPFLYLVVATLAGAILGVGAAVIRDGKRT
jgi:capsular polysaccharide biosynthesis protein